MNSLKAKIEGSFLIYNGKKYRIRYLWSKYVVCNTDELFGEYGDKFPFENVEGMK